MPIKLIFQKEFAFFNSINWKATSKNLITEIPKIRKTIPLEIVPEEASNAVDSVSINKMM